MGADISAIELDLLKDYMRFKINLLSAVIFKNHRSYWLPSQVVTTTLWRTQIPTFDEFKKDYTQYMRMQSFHGIGIYEDSVIVKKYPSQPIGVVRERLDALSRKRGANSFTHAHKMCSEDMLKEIINDFNNG